MAMLLFIVGELKITIDRSSFGRPACGRYGLYRYATEPRVRSFLAPRVSSLRVTIPLLSGRCAACALRLPEALGQESEAEEQRQDTSGTDGRAQRGG